MAGWIPRNDQFAQSITTNSNFTFVAPRSFTTFKESVFPLLFFVDGHKSDGQLSSDVACSFFHPNGFISMLDLTTAIGDVFAVHPTQPESNQGGINNYVVDPSSPSFMSPNTTCGLYKVFTSTILKSLYPNPTSFFKEALNTNLGFSILLSQKKQVVPRYSLSANDYLIDFLR
ncbi:hypothetical protein M422DRAFT_267618 [Sphaerobolus stellatus SS14]|uniref:Uncharacterized protein n=1 Tax=Sphaerobolus stellatus (strain SS14) TaxID=990650 RepID=A0A0C9TLL5_SPHS4|nr:hypothetical protein M422DRAFT_267618 [Sphaerobolus stellatus SS14]